MLSRRKLPLELGLGCNNAGRRVSRNEWPGYPGWKAEPRDSGTGIAGSAVTSSSRSSTTRMVESETSLVTVSNAGGGGRMPVFDFGDEAWGTLVFLEPPASHIVPLYLSSVSSDGTAER